MSFLVRNTSLMHCQIYNKLSALCSLADKSLDQDLCNIYCFRRNLLASGDAHGVVKVWKLNEELTTESASERDLLNSMVDTSSQE